MNTTLQVSRKVYSDISTRVSTALSGSPASASETMRVINGYLEGLLPESSDALAMLAFNMIRPELDRAMERSRRARERARARREAKAAAMPHPDDERNAPAEEKATVCTEIRTDNPQPDKTPFQPPLTRRQRRAAQRHLHKKQRLW